MNLKILNEIIYKCEYIYIAAKIFNCESYKKTYKTYKNNYKTFFFLNIILLYLNLSKNVINYFIIIINRL